MPDFQLNHTVNLTSVSISDSIVVMGHYLLKIKAICQQLATELTRTTVLFLGFCGCYGTKRRKCVFKKKAVQKNVEVVAREISITPPVESFCALCTKTTYLDTKDTDTLTANLSEVLFIYASLRPSPHYYSN